MILDIQALGLHWPTIDPFLFCAFHNDRFPAGNGELGPAASLSGRKLGMDFETRDGWRMYHGEKVPGFPGHPHRGFETITVVRQGLVDHADSLGAAGRYGAGDVQWMTAGRGIQHSEMFPLLNQQQENPLLLFQVWLNLPARNKLVDPHFTMFWSEQMPVYQHQDAAGLNTQITIVAGACENIKALVPPPDSWAAEPANEVAVWLIDMAPGASVSLPAVSQGLGRMLYLYEGDEISAGDDKIPALHCAQLDQQQMTLKNGDGSSKLLLLQGRPIGEPVAQHGPFVMNTREQLVQAFDDYQLDSFGGWPWPRQDQVHGERERFARYADGQEDEPTQNSTEAE